MTNKFFAAAWLGLTLTIGSTNAQVAPRMGPPPPRSEVAAPQPGPGYVWEAGYYRWDGRGYVWVPGQWVRPPRSSYHRWVPGRWKKTRRGWVWVEGHWRR